MIELQTIVNSVNIIVNLGSCSVVFKKKKKVHVALIASMSYVEEVIFNPVV